MPPPLEGAATVKLQVFELFSAAQFRGLLSTGAFFRSVALKKLKDQSYVLPYANGVIICIVIGPDTSPNR